MSMIGEIMTCKSCQKEFERTTYHRTYCSTNCKKEANRERQRKRLNYKKLEERKCIECGVVFMPRPSQKTCSNKCRTVRNIRRNKENYRRNNPECIKHCKGCGVQFKPTKPYNLYCTPECKRKTYNEKKKRLYNEKHGHWDPDFHCVQCGKKFKKTHRRQTICSYKCRKYRLRQQQHEHEMKKVKDIRPLKTKKRIVLNRLEENINIQIMKINGIYPNNLK